MFFRVENLTKKFGDFVAVDNVSISFKKDIITAIIGPNGAGKTTFINLCSGLLKPTGGRVYFNGQDITALKIHQRIKLGIARIFQIVNIFQGLSVLENIKIPVISRKRGKMEVNRTIDHLLELFNLERYRYTPASELPHGYQRLLEMSMALALEPVLLFLDEPLAGIDPKDRGIITDRILDLKGMGITVVFIEHDIESVFKIADEIIVMHKGGVIARGSPAEVRENRYVKEIYLGGA